MGTGFDTYPPLFLPLLTELPRSGIIVIPYAEPCMGHQYSDGVVHLEHQGPEIEPLYIVYPHRYALGSIRGTPSER